MKAKNVKVGLEVVIKGCAVGTARNYIGKTGVIDEIRKADKGGLE